MLDDLVVGVLSTTSNDVGGSRGLPQGDGILADILEPDVVDVARTLAVDTLSLVGTDDDVPGRITVSWRAYSKDAA